MKLRLARLVKVEIEGLAEPLWDESFIGSLVIVDVDSVRETFLKHKITGEKTKREYAVIFEWSPQSEKWVSVPMQSVEVIESGLKWNKPS